MSAISLLNAELNNVLAQVGGTLELQQLENIQLAEHIKKNNCSGLLPHIYLLVAFRHSIGEEKAFEGLKIDSDSGCLCDCRSERKTAT